MRLTILITFFLMRAFSAEAKIEREDIEVFSNPDQNTQKIDSKMLVFSGEGELCWSDLRDKKGLLPPSLRSELTDESGFSESEKIPACDENIDHALFNLAEGSVYEGEEVAAWPAIVIGGSAVAGAGLGCLSSWIGDVQSTPKKMLLGVTGGAMVGVLGAIVGIWPVTEVEFSRTPLWRTPFTAMGVIGLTTASSFLTATGGVVFGFNLCSSNGMKE